MLSATMLLLAACDGAPTSPISCITLPWPIFTRSRPARWRTRRGSRIMVEAHSKTSDELKSIVAAEKLDVALPSHLSKRYHSMIESAE
jgi:hypothetical protein